ncbi:MAG: HAMP domain-containing protein, partial [Chloroflexi bacterium]|nr:HAMP domain-containing protein [Chloroflexota bacterium]
MFPRIRWRIAISYLSFILLVMIGMSLYIMRPFCITSPVCIQQTLFVTTIIMVIGVIVIGHLVSERTARPLRQLTDVAQRITAGDKSARILPHTKDEVGILIGAFSQMAEQLQIQITDLSEDYYQLATAVQYMADGVIITDDIGHVHLINPAAIRLLETTEAKARNRSFAEVVRHHQLIELWQRCEQSGNDEVEAVEIGTDLSLQMIVTPFPQRNARGFLVVFQDLTTIRKLQTIRRDFVSNVSHELRTPLASVRAVVETLQSGAIADPPL